MERFARQGREGKGIEKFWGMINTYYSSLLELIFRHGGDVECFAGDALPIIFNASEIAKRVAEAGIAHHVTPTASSQALDPLELATLVACHCG
ncbi:unnamed protein product, partial [Chrysoparadoxa australica]